MTRRCRDWLLQLSLPHLAVQLEVRWNSRLRSTAGRAWPGRARIELNPRLKEISADEVERTVLHELAHLMAHARAGRRRIEPHGKEWRHACAELGIPHEAATHRLPLPRTRQQRRHHYGCPGCGRIVGRVQPLRREVACAHCCRLYAGGRFDARFRLVEIVR
ncbi:putative SprT family Zn-dependent metalloprotease [Haloferula luteola]|uniref:Putative SprT family Zn-dependent metalloprotease n=1 Tax=Haloferula luteola TaxID=595692 RepID=A0A840VGV6_9BACT|nr:SprT-like domain-containing protein [Haloferula luteola]MBB5353059.1 putative SprT family Zn-dependent metalloprotease [Haloferula luteola]